MAEQCKGTLYVPQGARCVRRTAHVSGYCHDHRHMWRPDLTEEQDAAAKAVVSTYTQDLALMSISQGGHRSLNYSDAQAIAALAYAAGLVAAEQAWEYGRTTATSWKHARTPYVVPLADTEGNVEYQRENGYMIVRRRKSGAWEEFE